MSNQEFAMMAIAFVLLGYWLALGNWPHRSQSRLIDVKYEQQYEDCRECWEVRGIPLNQLAETVVRMTLANEEARDAEEKHRDELRSRSLAKANASRNG